MLSVGTHCLLAVSAMATVAAIRSMWPRTTRKGQGSGCEERGRGAVQKEQVSLLFKLAGIYRTQRERMLKLFLNVLNI